MHIQYIYMQIYPKYIYKDLRFHPYSTIHATACSTETVGLIETHSRAARGLTRSGTAVTVAAAGSLTSSWPGGRGVCKPVTVTVEW